jgi:hypothetical protein
VKTKKKSVRWRYWLDGHGNVRRTSGYETNTDVASGRVWLQSCFERFDVEVLCERISERAARRIIKGGGK